MYAKSISWEWIAGFFEGEGHIYWQDGKKGTKQGTCGRLIIGQKAKEPLTAIYDFLLTKGFHIPQFYLRPPSKNSRSTPCWILSINWRDDVICMLSEMLPFLFQKSERARYVIGRLTVLRSERDEILKKALILKQRGHTWLEVCNITHCSYQSIVNYAMSAGVKLQRTTRSLVSRTYSV